MILERVTYKAILIILIFIQILIPKVEIILFSSLFCLLILGLERELYLSKTTFNTIICLGLIITQGIIISFFHNYKFYDISRDIIHYLKPLIVILSGYLLAQKIDNPKFIIKAIIYIASFLALKHLFILVNADFKTGKISEIREIGGNGNFIELLALLIILFKSKFDYFDVIKSKLLFKIILILILCSSFFYFSRTMILGFFIFFISFKGYTILTKKAIKYIGVFLIVFVGFYCYLFTLELDSQKPGIQNLFYKIRNAPLEVFYAPKQYDPKNHREIFDHWRAYEASMALKQMNDNVSNYVFGKGFGALVDLKFKAPIGGQDGLRYITHLHNGYIYIYLKTGIFGLCLYLFVLFNLYRQIYITPYNHHHIILLRLISGMALYFIFTSLVVTGIYNLQDISVLLLGIFLYLAKKESNIAIV